MADTSVAQSHRTGSIYGSFAYASVVLTCYVGFFAPQRYYRSEWMVPVVFALGAMQVALGVLSGEYLRERGRISYFIYYALQCSVLTAIIHLSPIRGFMGILVLPVLSQAVFDLRAGYAALVGAYLFAINLAVWAVPEGWPGVTRALVNYAAAFAFTIVFTLITKEALKARENAEKLRREVEAANAQLRESAAQTAELATTRERNRVAREIHDGVGHYLTVVKTQLDAATALLPTQPERARDAVIKAAKLAGDALDDVRASVGHLREDEARRPFQEALRELTDEAGFPVTIRVGGNVRQLRPGIEHALFRAAQEGLTNIRKHAAASSAEIVLEFGPDDRVTFTVTDDGRGDTVATSRGYGLVGIRERIALLGGKVEAGSRRDGGFALTIEVPA